MWCQTPSRRSARSHAALVAIRAASHLCVTMRSQLVERSPEALDRAASHGQLKNFVARGPGMLKTSFEALQIPLTYGFPANRFHRSGDLSRSGRPLGLAH